MTEAVQWIALGLAMVNDKFADILSTQVGPNGFQDGAVGLVYDQLECKLAGHEGCEHAIREILGLRIKGKLSSALVKFLADEATCQWESRVHKMSKAKQLARTLNGAIRELAAMARNDREVVRVVKPPTDYEGGDGI